jgi:hypothetical protein
MSVSSERELIEWFGASAPSKQERSARNQRAVLSSEVAEVANRPKKRPGRRERSSITTRWQTMLG